MQRILALQNLQAMGAERAIDDPEVELMISSCSYIGCGNCSSTSQSGCVPVALMIVNV